jgi:glutamine amidotransferase
LIAILDYGSGNIRSAQRALERVGSQVEVTSQYEVALNADGLVVPGVGAFGSCIKQLNSVRGDHVIKERLKFGRKTLGICVGMQVLFERSDESSDTGLGLLAGEVKRLSAPVLPHIGWNEVNTTLQMNLLAGIAGERFYFVHSYAALSTNKEVSTASSYYGETFIAAVEQGALSAVQFHPEKSGDAGLQLLKNWVSSI